MSFLGGCPNPEKHPIDLWCIFSAGIFTKKSQGAKYSQYLAHHTNIVWCAKGHSTTCAIETNRRAGSEKLERVCLKIVHGSESCAQT